MVRLRKLTGDSSSYVRAYAPFRLGAEHELPRRLDSPGCLVLGGAQCSMDDHAVAGTWAPGQNRPRAKKSGPPGQRRHLGTPLLRHLSRRRAAAEHQCGRGDDEGERPGHALK